MKIIGWFKLRKVKKAKKIPWKVIKAERSLIKMIGKETAIDKRAEKAIDEIAKFGKAEAQIKQLKDIAKTANYISNLRSDKQTRYINLIREILANYEVNTSSINK